MFDKPMTIDDFRSAADYSAYKNGGGDAARMQGKSVEDIIRQGIENIDAYDGDQDPSQLILTVRHMLWMLKYC